MERIYDQREDLYNARAAERPVHFPANPNKFEFDSEVTRIFPNMAARSIPNYFAFHKLHAEIVARWYAAESVRMIDFGASHGAFFTALKEFYSSHPLGETMPSMELVAVDNSEPMCEALRQKHPDAHVLCGSVTDEAFMRQFEGQQFDVVNATYLIQFVPRPLQGKVLTQLSDMVRPGGVIILGQKEEHTGVLGHMLHEMYIRWRMENGYTREEIEAKTRALTASMWPIHPPTLTRFLRDNFSEVHETTRTYMFSTLMAYK